MHANKFEDLRICFRYEGYLCSGGLVMLEKSNLLVSVSHCLNNYIDMIILGPTSYFWIHTSFYGLLEHNRH